MRNEAGVGGAGGDPSQPSAGAAGVGANTEAGAASERALDAGPGRERPADAAAPAISPDADVAHVCTGPIDARAYTEEGRELVVDVATTSMDVGNGPLTPPWLLTERGLPWIEQAPGCSSVDCLERPAYEAAIFGATDTAYTVLSGFAYALGPDGRSGSSPSTTEDLLAARDWLNEQLGAVRVLVAPAVMPNDRIDVQLAAMELWAEHAVAWRANTAWSPEVEGFWLDDELGRRMIEKGLALGRGIFLVDKGMLPFDGFNPAYTDPRDVGVVAAAYRDARFVVLQSAFEHGMQQGESSRPDEADLTRDFGWGPGVGSWPEGAYDELDAEVQAKFPLDRGINSLITSLREHGVEPNQNVYASLDGVWAELMTRPVEAAHVIGKLLKYVGEDNVLWGTQSLWYGGPRPQLEAFRAFQIPDELQEQYGYPSLTDHLKAKILGLNAARLFCMRP